MRYTVSQAYERAKERPGQKFSALCPVHNDRSPSLSLWIENGQLRVNCFAGCRASDIKWRLRSAGFDLGNREVSTEAEPYFDQRKMNRILETWESGRDLLHGDLADLYLQRRGISLEHFPSSLRFSPRVYCHLEDEGRVSLPAMLAKVEDNYGNLVQVHRTFLAPDGSGKANIPGPKRLMQSPCPGSARGAAIRLFPPGKTLGLAEGIETALACFLETRIPTWSTVSAHGLETFEVPEGVEHLVVFADNDASYTGEKAAEALIERVTQKISAEMRIPADQGRDFADERLSRRQDCERIHFKTKRAV
ncbi:MAG: toprim domain-containing protein [Candidatus Obscuribacterales bacterium]|nr:toprim domain-containing protein [Candidatus Obscuribacterales bacterium]